MGNTMKVSYTEDGYLKIKTEDSVNVDYTQLQGMNSLSYFVPSLKDRYEENVILYHKGEYSSVAEYVQGKVYLFKDFQALLLKLLQSFVKLEKDGYLLGNACVSLEHIFIHPQSGKIRIVYVPVEGQLDTNENCIKKLLSELLTKIQTKDSAILLGVLLENKNRNMVALENVIKDVEGAKEKNIDVSERIVEKRIEVPVEKVVYKSPNYKLFCGIVIIIDIIAGIIIPMILNSLTDSDCIEFKYIIMTNIVCIFIMILTIILLRDKEIVTETKKSFQNNDNKPTIYQEQQTVIDKIQKENTSLNFVENEMSNARISRTSVDARNTEIPNEKKENYFVEDIKEPKMQNQFAEEGTCVLYGDSTMSQAYFLESGKTGLMDRIFIDKPEFIIGREKEVDFKIDDSSVSKKHAKVSSVNGKYYIEDLNSSNGTKVDAVLIKNKMELTEGSQVKLGSKVYVFHNV